MSTHVDTATVAKAGAWYTISNFVVKALSFITVPIFARLLSTAEYGEYSNFATWLSLLGMVVHLNLSVSLGRAKFDYRGRLEGFCSSILFFGSVSTLFFYLIAALNIGFFSEKFSISPIYIHLMFLYLLSSPAMDIFQGMQRIFYKYKKSTIISFGSSIISTIVPLILVHCMQDKLQGRIIGFLIPLIIINSIIYAYLMLKGKKISLEYFKYAFLFSWPFIPHLLSTYILSASDKIMITKMIGPEANAIYSISCSCANLASLFGNSLNSALSPWTFEKLEEKSYDSLYKLTVPYFLLFFFAIQLLCLLAPEVVSIVGGEKYQDAALTLAPLLVGNIFQFAYFLYVNIEQYSRKTWAIAAGSAIAAGVNVVLNLILIPRFGYTAAAYTTLIGYIVLFVVHFVFVRHIGYKKIYNDKFVFAMLGGSLILVFLIQRLYSYILIRWIIAAMECVGALVFGYLKRDQIKMFIKKKK